ncbi:MAG: response regulator, partial [Acutalibacteraceae bacterium]
MFNILVVEDDVKMNQIYCSALKRDYNPIAAYDGKQALDVIAEIQIDLVISDIMMP